MKLPATLLPAIVVVLTLAACGSTTTTVTVTTSSPARTTGAATENSTGTASTPTTTTLSFTATAGTPTPAATVHLTTFRTPSKNIGCVMLDSTARCDISQRAWAPPPRPASCPKEVDFGQGLLLQSSGAGMFVCAGDTALDPTGAPLAYGTASVEGNLTCVSETGGVTCTNSADRHGFFISRQFYRVF
jgi:hypothetical protein